MINIYLENEEKTKELYETIKIFNLKGELKYYGK